MSKRITDTVEGPLTKIASSQTSRESFPLLGSWAYLGSQTSPRELTDDIDSAQTGEANTSLQWNWISEKFTHHRKYCDNF